MEINEIYKNETSYFSPIEINERYGLTFIFTSSLKKPSKEEPNDFNLSFNAEANPIKVMENRKTILDLCSIKTRNPIIFLRQTHSDKAIIIDEDFLSKYKNLYLELEKPASCLENREAVNKIIKSIPEGDAIITSMPDIPIMVFSADCNTVLICDINLRVISAVHAGWRGVINNILNKSLNLMIRKFGCNQKDLMLFLGPSIRKCCFEVDYNLYKKFKIKFPEAFNKNEITDNSNKYFIEMIDILKYQAIKTGVKEKNISIIEKCTCCYGKDLFFSYRRDKKAGRQAALAYIQENINESN